MHFRAEWLYVRDLRVLYVRATVCSLCVRYSAAAH